jgi:hypothetical protein
VVAAQTTPILEIGLILLAAVAAGWIARRLHLPAIVGYLAVGLGFSPFTPGYVADHEQLELLADVGVVLLLFGSASRSMGVAPRPRCGLLVAPAQVVLPPCCHYPVAGLGRSRPPWSGCAWPCRRRWSSSTSPSDGGRRIAEGSLLSWAVMRDLVGSGWRRSSSHDGCCNRWRSGLHRPAVSRSSRS